MSSFNWLHLSDFHFGKHEYEQDFSAKKLIEHITTEKDKGITPDAVFITGDVVNSGKPDEYKLFAEKIISPMVSLFGGNFIDNIFVVPGNHDLDRKVNDAFSKEKLIKTDADYFHPTTDSAKKRKILVERFDVFCEGIPITSIIDFSLEKGTFALERTVRGRNFGVIGINTAWLCDGEQDKETLTPGIALLRTALESLKSVEAKFVLGHHPLDWIHPSHRAPIQAVLAENHAIYFHGHMHAEDFSGQVIGAGEFITIQSGAAWQAPEGGRWKNGFMWGALNLEASTISLQPYSWNFAKQCWSLDGARFHEDYRNSDFWIFDAPKPRKKPDYSPKTKSEQLIGWDVKDLAALMQHTKKLDPKESVSYFDGATPTWAVALSESIPRREIVASVARYFKPDASGTRVCTLLGAGCEGKTTALLQSCMEILKSDPSRKVLYRTNHTRPFDSTEFSHTLQSNKKWLIVVDEADQVAREISRFIESGFDEYDGEIDFLLASRDSDWRSSGANNLPWDFRARHKEIILKDLSQADAQQIVDAWSAFGVAGLGEELFALPAQERADKLRYYAKKESKGNSDAFFGALLMSRHSNDLLEHAESMLNRLAAVELQCGKTLKDVLGYIAAMHAEGFDKLSFSTMAGLLGMTVSKLQSEVIRQLGKEAAATSTSTTIFTRHKYIASALIEVLENRFNENISQYFIDLAISEVDRSKTDFVVDLGFWRFEMADKLFSAGKTRLAVEITENLYHADESNAHLMTKLASFYRRLGNAEGAVKIFREFDDKPLQRAFYFEWGVCEGSLRHWLENALLACYALSDESDSTALTVENAKMCLTGLSKCCDQLHISFADPIFREAEGACYSLLNTLNRNTTPGDSKEADKLSTFLKDVSKNRRKRYARNESIRIISDMFSGLSQYGPAPDVACAIEPKSLIFSWLDRIVRNMETVS